MGKTTVQISLRPPRADVLADDGRRLLTVYDLDERRLRESVGAEFVERLNGLLDEQLEHMRATEMWLG